VAVSNKVLEPRRYNGGEIDKRLAILHQLSLQPWKLHAHVYYNYFDFQSVTISYWIEFLGTVADVYTSTYI
jgi:hypothetical protein